jgi:hypothetical protein
MEELIALDRREILKSSAGLLAGLVVAGSPLALIARGGAWAIELTSFTTPEGVTLMAATRTIMPHEKLDDAAYALVVKAIDRDAGKDERTRKSIKEGIEGLGAGFVRSTESERVAALKKVESSEFFRALRLKRTRTLAMKAKHSLKAATFSGDSMICIGCPKFRRRIAAQCQ